MPIYDCHRSNRSDIHFMNRLWLSPISAFIYVAPPLESADGGRVIAAITLELDEKEPFHSPAAQAHIDLPLISKAIDNGSISTFRAIKVAPAGRAFSSCSSLTPRICGSRRLLQAKTYIQLISSPLMVIFDVAATRFTVFTRDFRLPPAT